MGPVKLFILLPLLGLIAGEASDGGKGEIPQTSAALGSEPIDFVARNPEVLVEFELVRSDSKHYPEVHLLYRLETTSEWAYGGSHPSDKPVPMHFEKEGVYLIMLLAQDYLPTSQPSKQVRKAYRCLVDWSPPVVDILRTSCERDKVVVNWLAYDQHLPARPVQIYWVGEGGQKLVSERPNTGWAELDIPGPWFPGRVKIVVQDMAGNYAQAVSALLAEVPAPASQPAGSPTSQPVGGFVREPTVKPQALASAPAEPPSERAMEEYRIGAKYKAQGQHKLAEQHLRRACDMAPQLVSAQLDLADVLAQTNRYNESADGYSHALKLKDDCPEAWQGLGLVRLRQGKLKEAKECFQKLVQIEKDNIQGWMFLGDACWMLGERTEALRSWERAKALAEKQASQSFIEAAMKRVDINK